MMWLSAICFLVWFIATQPARGYRLSITAPQVAAFDRLPTTSSSSNKVIPDKGFDKGTYQMLTGEWLDKFINGQILTSLFLASKFSEKYEGKHMETGNMAEIKLPNDLGTSQPELVAKFGGVEASAYMWLCERTIYVAFAPMGNKYPDSSLLRRQMGKAYMPRKIYGAHPAMTQLGDTPEIQISSYVLHILRNKYGDLPNIVNAKLSEVLSQRQAVQEVLFAGISHGATLAQAAVYFCSEGLPDHGDKLKAVTWNAYKWTDKQGSQMVDDALGDRMLNFVVSHQTSGGTVWDSIAGFPSIYEPMKRLILLDKHDGVLRPCDSSSRRPCPGVTTPRYPLSFFSNMLTHHFAKTALKAVKRCMKLQLNVGAKLDDTLVVSNSSYADEAYDILLNANENPLDVESILDWDAVDALEG